MQLAIVLFFKYFMRDGWEKGEKILIHRVGWNN